MSANADTNGAPGLVRVGRARPWLLRAAALVFALIWLTFGFGLIDLSAIAAAEWDAPAADSSRSVGLLSVAYGAVATLMIAGAFGALALSSRSWPAAMQQIALVLIAFAVAGIVGLDPLSYVTVAMLAVMLTALRALHPRPRPPLWPEFRRSHRPVLVVVLAGVPAALVYGVSMLAESRARVVPDEQAARPQAGGWAGAAILAFAAILLGLLAATTTPGRRLPAWSTVLAVAAVAWTAAAQPSLPGSPGRLWGCVAALWALALVVTVEVTSRRSRVAGLPSR